MTDPDYRAAQVMNYVMGGGGSASRMMKRSARQARPAYGIYTLVGYRFADIADRHTVGTDNACA